MLLTIDVGNTNTVLGLFDRLQLAHSTASARTPAAPRTR